MKQQYFILCLSIVLHGAVYAQTQSNLSTPVGSTVTAWIVPEMSSSDRAFYDGVYAAPGRTQYSYFGDGYSSSRRFNCHGYAWSIAESGAARWIGYYVSSDEDIYMSDGSYVRVCSETYPGKVSWGDNDHSAVTTSTPGRWISKWGAMPLMNHHKDDNPYGTTDYRYYVSTAISGNAGVCTDASGVPYSVQAIAGATYSWTSSSNLTISGSGNAITVTPTASSGAAWIEVSISTGCGTATSRKNLNIEPAPEITGGTYTNAHPAYGQLGLGFNVICGYDIPSTITMDVSPGAYVSNAQIIAASAPSPAWWWGGNQIGFDGFSFPYAYATFQVVVTNSCGSNTYDFRFYVDDCPGELQARTFKTYPNPATTVLAVEPEAPVTTKNKTATGPYTVKLFNEKGVLLKTIENKTGNGPVTFNTSTLTPGFYYVQIIADGKTTRKTDNDKKIER